MIDEAREDNKENDAQYMKPGLGSRCKIFRFVYYECTSSYTDRHPRACRRLLTSIRYGKALWSTTGDFVHLLSILTAIRATHFTATLENFTSWAFALCKAEDPRG